MAVNNVFYPGEPGDLLNFIDENSPNEPECSACALIVPHAGYKYSGKTAALAFSSLKREFRTAIIIGPSHTMRLSGLSIAPHDAYETPFGQMEIDTDKRSKLLENPLFKDVEEAHIREHAIEVELPFLYQINPDQRIVPIICGHLSKSELKSAAQTIESVCDSDTVVIISSDFTHYGKRFNYLPFTNDKASIELEKLDRSVIDTITANDVDGLHAIIEKTGATVCGYLPIALLLEIFNSRDIQIKLCDYTNSGYISGDFETAVGYAGLSIRSL
ncbi:MAG: AmmeMemoRadiSam system protein B [Lentisphaeria bacterium]|nr:AmmeMemoRadiSam system protein B [Lentisphaeria bacterium]